MSIFSFLPAFASKAFVLAALQGCPAPLGAPVGDVFFAMDKPLYVTEAPSSVLTESQKKNPNAPKEGKWMVGGLNDGHTDISVTASFNGYGDQDSVCLFFENVTMTLVYRPTIFIASDFAHQACRSRVVRRHEERHSAVDIKTFNEFVPKMKMDLLWYLRSVGTMGPYTTAELPEAKKKIAASLNAAGARILAKLEKTRADRQSAIDTIENYKLESGLCPGEFPSIEELEKTQAPAAADKPETGKP